MTYWEQAAEIERNKNLPTWVDEFDAFNYKPSMVIFGGSGGLGKAIAPLLSSTYDVVCLSSKNLDIQNSEAVFSYFVNNPKDIVLNLAAKNYDSQTHKTYDNFFSMLETNVVGMRNIINGAIPRMRETGGGNIIYMSSFLSKSPMFGTGTYAACKSFNDTFIKAAAIENAKYNIRLNSILLGYTPYGLAEKVPAEVLQSGIDASIIKRPITAQEVVTTIKYILNTKCITGQNLDLSGGLLV